MHFLDIYYSTREENPPNARFNHLVTLGLLSAKTLILLLLLPLNNLQHFLRSKLISQYLEGRVCANYDKSKIKS